MNVRRRPALLYDGECGFCRFWVLRWRQAIGDKVDWLPYQEAAQRFPDIPADQLSRSVHLVEPGRVSRGAEAVFRLLAYAGGVQGYWLKAYRSVPGFAPTSEWVYRRVAENRPLFSSLTFWLWGRQLERSTYHFPQWLFLRLLALIFLCAFLSFGLQADGLTGPDGILPAGDYLRSAHAQLGAGSYLRLPTIAWLGSSARFLESLCAAGALLSLLALFGFLMGPCLAASWGLYLSLVVAGQEFMSFQWDMLLLETSFIAALIAPWRLRARWNAQSPFPGIGLWLLRWLLFRLMFQSGVVKLASGDPSWSGLTALSFHYETQPLPTWIGYWAHQLPARFHQLSAGGLFLIELAVPFLIFLPRKPRALAGLLFLALQAGIALTGNYCYFNWLAASLCLFLFDDAMIRRLLPDRLTRDWQSPPPRSAGRIRSLSASCLAALVALFSAFHLSLLLRLPLSLPQPIGKALRLIEPLRLVNSYGLFAVMTTSRPEIMIEGSDDGKTWLRYEFKWKPGDPGKRPSFVAPHQPRLDWQMWFAALSRCQDNPWFVNFLFRLLQGSKPVRNLLSTDPFPNRPPRYLRATLHDYRFTSWKEPGWWRAKPLGLYCPIVSLRRENP
ncbi:MAG: lipase maturation factor family protein [Elusimicrobia bacterium]|nr:lipase maturation factor family protein [Elusimicrobiota bacterium]